HARCASPRPTWCPPTPTCGPAIRASPSCGWSAPTSVSGSVPGGRPTRCPPNRAVVPAWVLVDRIRAARPAPSTPGLVDRQGIPLAAWLTAANVRDAVVLEDLIEARATTAHAVATTVACRA